MKLVLVFCIIGGLISCSLQQSRPFRAGWFPNSFQRARLPYYYFADQDADIAEMDPRLYDLPANDVQQGHPAYLSPFFKTWKSSRPNPQSRFFGFMLYNQLKNSLLFPSVSTVTFTSTSTSAADCPGKKRSIELDAVEPSKVIPIETSRIARNYSEKDLEPYAISPSFSDNEESNAVAPRQFVGGLFPSYSKVFPSVPTSIQIVTVTSTTTSFSLIASAVKKPVAIATLAPVTDPITNVTTIYGGVLCLPPGFVVC